MKPKFLNKVGKSNYEKIVRHYTLGVETTFEKWSGYGWGYVIREGKRDEYYDFINEFLNLLEGKERELEAIGIMKEHITFWMVYEYENQCNLKFRPDQMKSLGEKGYGLCISCYESSSVNQEI